MECERELVGQHFVVEYQEGSLVEVVELHIRLSDKHFDSRDKSLELHNEPVLGTEFRIADSCCFGESQTPKLFPPHLLRCIFENLLALFDIPLVAGRQFVVQ